MLKNCGRGLRPIRLCVEKTLKNFDELKRLKKILMKSDSARPVGQNGAKILIGPFSPNLKPLE